MKTLFEKLHNTLEQGGDAVLVTVVASSGSTPRGAGARMLVTREGRIYGTIGGGAVEYKSEQIAQEVLEKKNSLTENFLLRKNDVLDLGMVCGGDVTVYFHYIPEGDADTITLCKEVADCYKSGEQCFLITDITANGSGSLSLYGVKRGIFGPEVPSSVIDNLKFKPSQFEADGRLYYAEILIRSGRVYIFGGGHVAQALVPALSAVNFRCVILEDREDFCRPELFPGVEETMLIDNNHIEDYIIVTPEDYICIMTRGHKDDMICEAYAMKTPACYIGVIGSRRKVASVNAKLMDMGFTEEDLARITTPIGLDIMAETPAEIAVSITAQMIHERAKRTRAAGNYKKDYTLLHS